MSFGTTSNLPALQLAHSSAGKAARRESLRAFAFWPHRIDDGAGIGSCIRSVPCDQVVLLHEGKRRSALRRSIHRLLGQSAVFRKVCQSLRKDSGRRRSKKNPARYLCARTRKKKKQKETDKWRQTSRAMSKQVECEPSYAGRGQRAGPGPSPANHAIERRQPNGCRR